MANYVQNFIMFVVPDENASQFRKKISGPETRPLPASVNFPHHYLPKTLSAHEIIEIKTEWETIEQKFRQHPDNKHYPDWMPVSLEDAVLLKNMPQEIENKEVPFSIFRLTPIINREEFDTFFPAKMENGFWKVDKRSNLSSIVDRTKIGTNPHLIDLREKELDTGKGKTAISFEYTTKWSPIGVFRSILQDLLVKHRAKAIHVWLSSDDEGGYEYIDPSENVSISMSLTESLIESDAIHEDENEEDEDRYGRFTLWNIADLTLNDVDDIDFTKMLENFS